MILILKVYVVQHEFVEFSILMNWRASSLGRVLSVAKKSCQLESGEKWLERNERSRISSFSVRGVVLAV